MHIDNCGDNCISTERCAYVSFGIALDKKANANILWSRRDYHDVNFNITADGVSDLRRRGWASWQ